MKRFILTIDLENDAFQHGEDPNCELEQILGKLVRDVRRAYLKDEPLALLDSNGNTVGTAQFTDEA
jgi:hypothetical protein